MTSAKYSSLEPEDDRMQRLDAGEYSSLGVMETSLGYAECGLGPCRELLGSPKGC